MKFKHPFYFLMFAQATFGLISCGPSGSDKANSSEEFKEAQKETLKQQLEDVVNNIPSPTEIPYILQATGADFDPSLVNPRTKVDQYATRHDKAALNLGVYAADIGYLASYEKTQDAISYLSTAKTLAENLNVIGAFDTEVLQKFEANVTNKDSLGSLLDRTIKKTENFLKDDNRNKLSALVITGSFVEGLYISTAIVKNYPKNILPEEQRNIILTKIMQTILLQKKSVTELKNMLASLEQTEPVVSISEDLRKLESAYANLNIEEKIQSNKADLVLSDKNLVEITDITAKLRNRITE